MERKGNLDRKNLLVYFYFTLVIWFFFLFRVLGLFWLYRMIDGYREEWRSSTYSEWRSNTYPEWRNYTYPEWRNYTYPGNNLLLKSKRLMLN